MKFSWVKNEWKTNKIYKMIFSLLPNGWSCMYVLNSKTTKWTMHHNGIVLYTNVHISTLTNNMNLAAFIVVFVMDMDTDGFDNFEVCQQKKLERFLGKYYVNISSSQLSFFDQKT